MRAVPVGLLALAVGCAAPAAAPPPTPSRVQVGSVDCNDPNACVGKTSGCRMACGMVREDRRQEEEIRQRQEAANPDELCQAWAAMGPSSRVDFIEADQAAWCDAYDLSPETCWCLANERSLDRQLREITSACGADSKADPQAALDGARARCDALPDE